MTRVLGNVKRKEAMQVVKRMKVAICDACGKTDLIRKYYSWDDSWEVIPCGWEYRTRKELLCDKCAKAYERLLEEVKLGDTDG